MSPRPPRGGLLAGLLLAHIGLLAALAFWSLGLPLEPRWRGAVLAVAATPLLLAVAGLLGGERRTQQWLAMTLVAYVGLGAVEVIASQRTAAAPTVILFLALAELWLVLLAIRTSDGRQARRE